MNDTEFLKEIEKTFHLIETIIDTWNEKHDLIIEVNRDANVLEVEFETRKKIILNAQTPMIQLWMASELGAFHFKYENQHWIDSRGQGLFIDIFVDHSSKLSKILFDI
ncbi:MAG: iron donor protein CyaY [Betaproteobacteria bacterium TMED156]|nr:MAG: iron donor protein CyaY [Betaproteobacteria bacterium TMED156]